MNRRSLTLAAWSIAAIIGTAGALAYAGGFRLNFSASAPVGLWQVQATPAGALARGTAVSVCPPNTAVVHAMHSHGYLPAGACDSGTAPLLKPVGALPGDVVTVRPGMPVQVNGRTHANTAAMPSLPAWPAGDHIVQPGEIWLLSSYAGGSFDSRYFGPVPISSIKGVAHPLLTRGDFAAMTQTMQGDL